MEPIKLATVAAANAKSRRLRELVRAPEILVMPGAYDLLSALLFEQMGFKAIQGTSGGIAAALGYPDGEVMSRDLFVEITGKFATAVSVPVNADGFLINLFLYYILFFFKPNSRSNLQP